MLGTDIPRQVQQAANEKKICEKGAMKERCKDLTEEPAT